MATMKLVPVVLMVVCSCVIPDSDEVAQTQQYLTPHCDDWGCGMNSPYLGERGLHFILADGTESYQGFKLTQFEKSGITYRLNVRDGRITGTRRVGTLTFTIANLNLIGAQFHLSYLGVETYVVKITGVHEAPLWAMMNGQYTYIQTYTFEWLDPVTNEFENVCTHPGDDDTLGMYELSTLVFEGDVIDEKTKTVSPTIDNNVINFGCAGGALAKQHLTGHTEVARRLGLATTTDERTTNLKMIVGDYCGKGKAFTVGGQILQWADHDGWMEVQGNATREAQWTSTGAACLEIPRLLANPPPINQNDFPNLLEQIKRECGDLPPACAPGASAYEPDPGFHLISANPT